METGETYQDRLGNKLTVINIAKPKVYYVSPTKIGGLIDNVGRYFLLGSLYHRELKKISDKQVTTVIFKKENNDGICAFFPYDIIDSKGSVTSYSHIGQHSAASISYMVSLRPCSLVEAQDIINELLFIGYNIRIQKRISYRFYEIAYNLFKQRQ